MFKTTCTVLAVFLHFFVLSIFCWMLSEGIQLYFSLVKVIGAGADINIRFFYCLGWGKFNCMIYFATRSTEQNFDLNTGNMGRPTRPKTQLEWPLSHPGWDASALKASFAYCYLVDVYYYNRNFTFKFKGKVRNVESHHGNDRKHLQFNIPWLNFLVFLLGLPAFVVSISLAVTQGRGYTDMRTCWLNTRNHVLWAFVVPALLIVSVSLAALQDFHQLKYPRLNASTVKRLLHLALIAKSNQNAVLKLKPKLKRD